MDKSSSPAIVRLCHSTEIQEGEARGFSQPSGLEKIIVTRREGLLYGWLDSCPHYLGGSPMAWRDDAYLDGSGTYLACHAHGALFEIETGECVSGPCIGQRLTPVFLVVDDAGYVSLA